MTEIIPAIIPKSFEDLENKLSLMSGVVSMVQIDILDGKFTSDGSWPYLRTPDPDFVKIIKEEEGFPFWEDLDFEVDLMVLNPEASIQEWISAGAKRVIVHYESFPSKEKALTFARSFSEQFGKNGPFVATELGFALNIDTDIGVLEEIVEYIDFIQCMGIAVIGRQGEPFDERVLQKISGIRSKYPDVIISIDGGVNLDSAQGLIEAGASRLVAGSAIFGSDDIVGTIEELENL